MIRKKLGKCIGKYGDMAYELLSEEENGDETWRIIYDLPMFAKGIHLTLSEFEVLGKEDIDSIINCLLREGFLKYDFLEKRYEIVYCPSDLMHYERDPYYLRLCFIAFILEADKRTLICNFIEASFLCSNKFEISDGEKERFRVLQMDEWTEEIVKLYQKYSMGSWGDISILRQRCNKVRLFVQTEVSEDAHRY